MVFSTTRFLELAIITVDHLKSQEKKKIDPSALRAVHYYTRSNSSIESESRRHMWRSLTHRSVPRAFAKCDSVVAPLLACSAPGSPTTTTTTGVTCLLHLGPRIVFGCAPEDATSPRVLRRLLTCLFFPDNGSLFH